MEGDDDMGGPSTKRAVRRMVQFSVFVSLQPGIVSVVGYSRRQWAYRDM